ncbi:unannotated protein [freshwater metagenome]|uniref:Unannotated protein n=1 Tax=freshwater metagenome TaxID=449393 RepID=A0A6J6W3I1_9ZZZZ|nr:FtsQ-type POTRA domain-containing protein [Actinomycetota bacterium]MSW23081.1 FtsQ-type POTRA domain-containing protein [Actinomycetota bacterium]MSW75124.1 FtsQ-type POTRA domain-containing protein [Actinomycetota bacterium]MSY30527.1 FtsQ-type POTRA domain-containing protein [Actinomycetota bacterium]
MRLLVAAIVLGCLAYVLGWSSLLTVQDVKVFGAPNEKSAIALKVQSSIVSGQKLARLEPRVITQKLQKIDWIENVKVSRNWINRKVEIRITARLPIASLGSRFIDINGKIFSLESAPSRTLPVLKSSTPEAAKFAISLLVALPSEIRSELRGLEALNQNSATLILHNSRTGRPRTFAVIWGDENSMDFKVKVYKALIALPENRNISEIDLSAPHAPIVK